MTETISAVTGRANLFGEPRLSSSNFTVGKNEEISGDVILQHPDKQKRYVHLKVYRTSLEHFAVVYPLKRLSKPIGIINIRNTCITPIDDADSSGSSVTGFIINQRMFDVTTSVTLYCDASTLPAWIDAFTSHCSPTISYQTSLPIVTEEDAD